MSVIPSVRGTLLKMTVTATRQAQLMLRFCALSTAGLRKATGILRITDLMGIRFY